MAKLTREDIIKLAHLARIDLSDAEIDEFEHEFNDILQYVEQLQAVNVNGLEPTSQVTGLTNVTREDAIKNYGYKASDLLKNAPVVENNQLKVKRMIG
jgi:aspartyl-tRNA(Asn)/glutamyl-tRNA(Gln) amidotransferase subunit C